MNLFGGENLFWLFIDRYHFGAGVGFLRANGLAIARRYILFGLLEFLPSAYLVDDADDGAGY